MLELALNRLCGQNPGHDGVVDKGNALGLVASEVDPSDGQPRVAPGRSKEKPRIRNDERLTPPV